MTTCSWSYSEFEDGVKYIEVRKGSPVKAKYCIFYIVKKDPVVFCKGWEDVRKELKRLRKREDVKQGSIRVFKQVNV